MISRRDAVKLAAAGFLVPSSQVFANTGTPVASPDALPMATPTAGSAVTQSTRGSWPMSGGNPARSGSFPGPIPSFDEPIIVRWRYQPEDDWISPTAAVMDDGVIFLIGERNVYAVDADSGLEYWRFGTRDAQSVAVSNGVLYVPTYWSLVHAIDINTGLELWRHSQPVGPGTPEANGPSYYSPVPVGDTLVVSSDAAIVALNSATGDMLWSFPIVGWSTYSVVESGLVLVSNDRNLSAIDLASGVERWRNTSMAGAVAVVNGVVISGGDSFLSGLDLESGQEMWRYSRDGYLSSRSIAGNTLVLGIATENDYGGYRGEIQALDIATGGLLWLYSLEDSEYGEFRTRVVQDQLFVQSRETETLHVIDVNTGLQVWEYRGYITNVDPIAVDQMLYLVHDQELFAIGNLLDPVLMSDVTLRAAPAESGIERGTASAGDPIDNVGARAETNGEPWVEITVGGVIGWIPASAIDPMTLPPEGDIWTLYDPAWF